MPQSMPLFPDFLDQHLQKVFLPLCEEVTEEQLIELSSQITTHLQKVKEALQHNEFIDLSLATQIATVLIQLLKEISKYPNTKRGLITGAVRYFTRGQDVQADFTSILGFDDDAAVLNYVLTEIGRSDLKVEL